MRIRGLFGCLTLLVLASGLGTVEARVDLGATRVERAAATLELVDTRPTFRTGFACTGSMEPTIDCRDVGIFLLNPRAEEIRVGDVIIFTGYTAHRTLEGIACRFHSLPHATRLIAHRVIAERTEGGVPYYQTKGDAYIEADPCWIPYPYVHSKLIKLLKGAANE